MAAATVDISKAVANSDYQVHTRDSYNRVRFVDFAEAVTEKGSALVSGNTIDVLPIFDGELVRAVHARQVVKGTASSTVQVGYDGSATAFIASLSCDGEVDAFSSASLGSTYFTAAKAVRLTCVGTAPQTGVIQFVAEIVPVGTGTNA